MLTLRKDVIRILSTLKIVGELFFVGNEGFAQIQEIIQESTEQLKDIESGAEFSVAAVHDQVKLDAILANIKLAISAMKLSGDSMIDSQTNLLKIIFDCGSQGMSRGLDVIAANLDLLLFNYLSNCISRGIHFPLEVAIRLGFNLSMQRYDGYQLMHFAAGSNNKEAITLLLDNGALLNVWDKERICSPLLNALQINAIDVVRLLIKNGACVNDANVINLSPLHVAALIGNLEVVRELLDAGADVHAQTTQAIESTLPVIAAYSSPLHLASRGKHEAVVALLLEHNADPRLLDADGSCANFAKANELRLDSTKLLRGIVRHSDDTEGDKFKSNDL